MNVQLTKGLVSKHAFPWATERLWNLQYLPALFSFCGCVTLARLNFSHLLTGNYRLLHVSEEDMGWGVNDVHGCKHFVTGTWYSHVNGFASLL